MFEYKIENIFSTISFDNYQIIVIELSDKEGGLFKGIGVSPASSFGKGYLQTNTNDYYQPFIINAGQALLFCNYISEVLNGSLPRGITICTDGPEIRINLKKYIEKWHGGGGYRGRLSFGSFLVFGILSNITIAKKSLANFRESLIDLYQLEGV